ncbi:transmembrane channel-like protein 6 isoform X2 [Galleria mellonella]|uniref:Transmembrane channel-like protein 6 isoform X2 n=1 Tax=Galleria mellonella TaxID=7137 RepID=A0ABM3N6W1_GALME|nr:transmembrane channel-like protein 6 isoform X2 [Galleria mellonella]XP_052759320.1 transmembrane channel-like protein 6 isoform X2 [Galleria mellonella]XP_052759321.1 transmembrane channel-like protein 6 isoform X2 [Galleria mellonella]XP_052759322.1 transmembrane channel-like protein 6 isoform X2 [Galleria mellonella]
MDTVIGLRDLITGTMRQRRCNSERNALLEEYSDATDSADRQADIIVRDMELDDRLMKNSPVSEERRREALRELPRGLTIKRHVRAKLSASVSLRSKRPISFWKRLKYRTSFAIKKLRDRLLNLVFSVELWYRSIRTIEGHFGSAVGTYFYFLRALFIMNVFLMLMVVAFVVIPQSLHDGHTNTTSAVREEGRFLDFISGKGMLEHSLLFYGHYHSGEIAAGGPLSYDMSFAYFFTMLSVCMVIFIILCYRTADSYRRNFIGAGGGARLVFASKVFCGWDCGVVSARAAASHAAGLYLEFKELLNEQDKNQVLMSSCGKLCRYLINAAVTTAVLAVILGLQYGLWKLLELESHAAHWELAVSITVALMVSLCPLVFDSVVRMEYYNPRTALYVTLGRTWLLDMSTLVLLFYFWANSAKHCWETRFGQEMYRLVLLDAFISLFVLPAIEFGRAFIYNLNYKTSPPEFNIAYNSLTLIYNQAVVWFGVMFSPLLVAAVAVKLLLLFYVKKECTMRACQPARKVWRAAQTQTVLYMLVTLSLFVTLFAVGSIFMRMSSQQCGPLQQYSRVVQVVTEGLLHLHQHPYASAALGFVTRPGVIGFLLTFLSVFVYYTRARAVAQASMVDILQRMVSLQAKDKEFLLGAITKVSNGEWLYSPKEDDEGPDSHTWKYLREVRKPSNSGFHFDASRLSHSFVDRPQSYVKENRSNSYYAERSKSQDDGDTDSSFSWKDSSNCLNRKGDENDHNLSQV